MSTQMYLTPDSPYVLYAHPLDMVIFILYLRREVVLYCMYVMGYNSDGWLYLGKFGLGVDKPEYTESLQFV